MKSRVFIVQRTLHKNRETGKLEERYSVDRAEVFGELHDLLSPSASPFHPDPVLRDLHAKLRDYRVGDYILCLGNPILIGWAVAIASLYAEGKVSCLQWSGTSQRYIPVESDIMRHAQFGSDEFNEPETAINQETEN